MSPAEVNIQTIKAGVYDDENKANDLKYKFIAKSENILFDGFLRVYKPVETKEHDEDSESENESIKSNKKLEKNQVLNLQVYLIQKKNL